MPCKHRVPIAADRQREPVQANNAVEEGTSDGSNSVGVAKGDEVGVLGETVHRSQVDGLARDLGQPLDEVRQDVGPNLGGTSRGCNSPASCVISVLLHWQVVQERTQSWTNTRSRGM